MVILGSTGSIGVNALTVAERHNLDVELLSAGSNAVLLREQILRFHPPYAVIIDKTRADILAGLDCRIFVGEEGLLEALSLTQSKKVLNAIVGFAGLKPTVESIALGKHVALANKESLVTAGAFLDQTALIPVDSEHFALWYLSRETKPHRMIITASGGALRDMPIESMANASVAQVLAHPNWKMGKKITVDSATMVNKLFELLEARWLFGNTTSYDALIEKSSTVHALIEFADGITTAQLSAADMQIPISYALVGKHNDIRFPSLDLLALNDIRFEPIDTLRYPLWQLSKMILDNPKLGVILNAANEAAVHAFLQGDIPYGSIERIITSCIERFESTSIESLADVFCTHDEVLSYAKRA